MNHRYPFYVSAMQAQAIHQKVADRLEGLENLKRSLLRRPRPDKKCIADMETKIERLRRTVEMAGRRYARRYEKWLNA